MPADDLLTEHRFLSQLQTPLPHVSGWMSSHPTATETMHLHLPEILRPDLQPQ